MQSLLSLALDGHEWWPVSSGLYLRLKSHKSLSNRRLGGPQIASGRLGERRNLLQFIGTAVQQNSYSLYKLSYSDFFHFLITLKNSHTCLYFTLNNNYKRQANSVTNEYLQNEAVFFLMRSTSHILRRYFCSIKCKMYLINTLIFTFQPAYYTLDVCGSVHHSRIRIENPTRCHSVSKFYFIIIWSSTRFGLHTAHYQEPKTALAASDFAYV